MAHPLNPSTAHCPDTGETKQTCYCRKSREIPVLPLHATTTREDTALPAARAHAGRFHLHHAYKNPTGGPPLLHPAHPLLLVSRSSSLVACADQPPLAAFAPMADCFPPEADDLHRRWLPREIFADIGIVDTDAVVPDATPDAAVVVGVEELAAQLAGILGGGTKACQLAPPRKPTPPPAVAAPRHGAQVSQWWFFAPREPAAPHRRFLAVLALTKTALWLQACGLERSVVAACGGTNAAGAAAAVAWPFVPYPPMQWQPPPLPPLSCFFLIFLLSWLCVPLRFPFKNPRRFGCRIPIAAAPFWFEFEFGRLLATRMSHAVSAAAAPGGSNLVNLGGVLDYCYSSSAFPLATYCAVPLPQPANIRGGTGVFIPRTACNSPPAKGKTPAAASPTRVSITPTRAWSGRPATGRKQEWQQSDGMKPALGKKAPHACPRPELALLPQDWSYR
ncbi:hypothetical protein HU200_019691 [Digitaria exilis]|uniref:Uncharacterized protein n=1 Tax=Digitaria exilis TaxID=1010633 RepID=A0A835F2E6_9POAL|nr:hypothetical protein HU200_019691 [Digitaria exilis]